MKRTILIIALLFTSLAATFAQGERGIVYGGLNLPPLVATTIDLRGEYLFNPHYSAIVGTGYTVYGWMEGPLIESEWDFDYKNRSGAFFKVMGLYNLRDRIAQWGLYIGAGLGYSLVLEEAEITKHGEGEYGADIKTNKNNTAHILGFGVPIGITSPLLYQTFVVDAGFELFTPIAGHHDLISDYSYVPGMGPKMNIRPTAVLTVKYFIM